MPSVNGFRLVCAATIALIATSTASAERVGYAFAGSLIGNPASTYSLFGKNVAQNASVSGTFSYDTTALGTFIEETAQSFSQAIQGGLSLVIDDGENPAINLHANNFKIVVSDDFEPQNAPEPIDSFALDFSRFGLPSDPAIYVDGAPWPSPALFKLDLSWAHDTFTELDEPKLTSDRPTTPGAFATAFVGSSFTPRLFSLNSIVALPAMDGDYNRSGAIGSHDFAEWRRVFGAQNQLAEFADGNGDGSVDAADYVVWRRAMSAPAENLQAIPEPGAFALVAALLATIGLTTRRAH